MYEIFIKIRVSEEDDLLVDRIRDDLQRNDPSTEVEEIEICNPQDYFIK